MNINQSSKRLFVPAGRSLIPTLLLQFLMPLDLSNYCTYLEEEHNFPREILEEKMCIAEYVELESKIIESLHDLSSLPSRADREPLLRELNYPERLNRYFEPGMKLKKIDEDKLLFSFYGLYESATLGGMRLFLLPDATGCSQNSSQPSYASGQIIVLSPQRPTSVGIFTLAKVNGEILLGRLGCNSYFKLVWNEEIRSYDLLVGERVVFTRRSPLNETSH